MKNFILYISAIISLVGCNNIPTGSFRLEGFVEGAKDNENIMIYYYELKNGDWYQIADTSKIRGGKFIFTGHIGELTAAELVFEEPINVVISVRLYLEPTTMKLQINKNQPYAYKLTGTKVEQENNNLRKEIEPYEKVLYENCLFMDDLITKIQLNHNNPLLRDSLTDELRQFVSNQKVVQEIHDKYFNFILKQPNYRIVPDIIFLIAKLEFIPVDTLKSVYNSLPKQSKIGLMGNLAYKQIEYLERGKNSFVGCTAPDFTRKDVSGGKISLTDYKNKKFVLLDFWASWCEPCIKVLVGENSIIKSMYDKYCEQGFTIIGISLDDDRTRWYNIINTYNLHKWPQVLSMTDENKSIFNTEDLTTLYNVKNGIPCYILIDKQGKIAARWEGSIEEEQLAEIDKIINSKQ